MSSATSVGVIGLGKMGYHMAHNLARAGFTLLVDDMDRALTERVAEECGATSVSSLADWAEADIVILMLPNSDIVESVVLGGLADAMREGALLVDMSSSDPLRTRALAETLSEHGIRFIDAPVSGGVIGAQQGSLSIMVGGDGTDLEEARPILDALGRTVIHVGPHGAGHAAKALNNLVSAVTLTVTGEALQTAIRFGIDPSVMNDVLNASSGRSNTSERKVEQFFLSGAFDSGFTVGLMAKDMRTSVALAQALGIEQPVGAPGTDYWSRVAQEQDAEADHTRVFEYLGRS